MTAENMEIVNKFKARFSIEAIEIKELDDKEVIHIIDNNKSFGATVDYAKWEGLVTNAVRHTLYCMYEYVLDNRNKKEPKDGR